MGRSWSSTDVRRNSDVTDDFFGTQVDNTYGRLTPGLELYGHHYRDEDVHAPRRDSFSSMHKRSMKTHRDSPQNVHPNYDFYPSAHNDSPQRKTLGSKASNLGTCGRFLFGVHGFDFI